MWIWLKSQFLGTSGSIDQLDGIIEITSGVRFDLITFYELHVTLQNNVTFFSILKMFQDRKKDPSGDD